VEEEGVIIIIVDMKSNDKHDHHISSTCSFSLPCELGKSRGAAYV
jgi:hypothetical protein